MISDGMGYNQMLAGDYFQYGATGEQAYQQFPVRTAMSTYSVYGSYDPLAAWGLFDYAKNAPTDSASAATAMSTGVKNQDGVIGVDVNGKPLYHVAQRAEVLKKSTGVVTSVEWSHATPAGSSPTTPAATTTRRSPAEMINDSGTDVIMGAGSPLFDDNGAPVATPSQYKYVGGVDTWNALVNGTAGGDADGDGDADPLKLIQSKLQFKRLAYAAKTPARVCGTARSATTLQQSRAGNTMAAPYTVPMNANVPDLATMTRARSTCSTPTARASSSWSRAAPSTGRVTPTSPAAPSRSRSTSTTPSRPSAAGSPQQQLGRDAGHRDRRP